MFPFAFFSFLAKAVYLWKFVSWNNRTDKYFVKKVLKSPMPLFFRTNFSILFSMLLNFVFGTMKFHNYLWLLFHLPEHLLLRNTGKETYFLSCKGYYNRQPLVSCGESYSIPNILLTREISIKPFSQGPFNEFGHVHLVSLITFSSMWSWGWHGTRDKPCS